jgi:uncharacterized membrane protein YfcA
MTQGRAFRLAMLTALVTLCLFAMCEPQSTLATQIAPALVDGAGLFAAGLAIGGYGTIVGIGGGPLLVPILHFMFAWPIEEVVASSLFVVFLNATSGSVGYASQKRIDVKGGVAFSVAALPGALLSGLVHHLVRVPFFDIIFGVFLLALAGYTVIRLDRVDAPAKLPSRAKRRQLRRIVMVDAFKEKYDFYTNQSLGISLNLVLGFVAGFLGIGGGVLQVPILVFLLGYPIHIATATSHFVTMLTAAFALTPNVLLGNVHFAATAWLGAGVVVGAQIGAKLATRLRSKAILYLFAAILVVFAVRLFLY